MDMTQLSNVLLEVFYMMIGLYMGLTMVFTLKDDNHKTRIGTALFWGILSAVFMFGDYIPSPIVGALVVVIVVLSATKQINIGTLKQLDETFATLKAEKLGLKIFIPSLSIAIIAMLIASFTDFSGTVAIGISSTLTLVLTFVITKAKPKEFLEDSNRMYQSMGSFVILPQLLASLGVLFTAAGVGDKNICYNIRSYTNWKCVSWGYCLLCRYGSIYSNNGKCICSIFCYNCRGRFTICICSRWRSSSLFSTCTYCRILWNIINSNGCKLQYITSSTS